MGGDYFGQLHFARYDPLGQAWTSPETIPTSEQQFAGEDDGILPTIAVAPNGEVYVAWQEFVGSSDGIWVYRRDTNGAWSQDFSSNQLYTETKPTLTAAPDGTIYLAWQNEDDGTIQIRRRDTNGAWASEPAIPQSSGYAAQYPALAADSQSNIFLVYDQQFDLHLTRRDAVSGTWGIDPNLGNPSGGEAEVAVGPDDSLYIIWAAGARRRDAAGTWEDLGDSVDVAYGFDLTVDPFGQYHKIEDDPSDTSGDDLQIWVDGMGILPDPSGGRSSIINPFYPTMAVGEAGNLTAIWQAQPTQDDPARLYISINQPQVTKHYYTSGGNQRIATRVAGQVYYIHTDHLGSTSLVTDESGNEVSRVQYSPYGAIIEQSGSLPTDRLYTGQRFESGIELYDYRARFYDPYLNQFISPDPIIPDPAHPQSWNRYAYVFNNPVRYTDPSGHCPPSVCNINGFPSDPYYASSNIQKIHLRGLMLQSDSTMNPHQRLSAFMDYAGSLYEGNETTQFVIDVTTVMFGQNYDPNSESRFADFRDYAWSPYYIGHGGFDPNYFDGVNCRIPDTCDIGYKDRYRDDSGGQARHFWFFLAVAFFDGQGISSYGNFIHDGAGTWFGNALQTNPTTRAIIEYPVDGVPPFSPATEQGVSAADFYIGQAGVDLGGKLRLNTLNHCVPGSCYYFPQTVLPSEVGTWIRTHLGE